MYVNIRPVEQRDIPALITAELAWNTNITVDEDFGTVTTVNPYAVTAKDILGIIRQRKDSEKGECDTRTYVLETMRKVRGIDIPVIQGAFAYEKLEDAFEVLYMIISPGPHEQKIIAAAAQFLKELAERSGRRKRVAAYVRDRDEAGLRRILPVWMKEGYAIILVPSHFGDYDGWEATYVATSPAGLSAKPTNQE